MLTCYGTWILKTTGPSLASWSRNWNTLSMLNVTGLLGTMMGVLVPGRRADQCGGGYGALKTYWAWGRKTANQSRVLWTCRDYTVGQQGSCFKKMSVPPVFHRDTFTPSLLDTKMTWVGLESDQGCQDVSRSRECEMGGSEVLGAQKWMGILARHL